MPAAGIALEKHLILNKFFLDLLGKSSFDELQPLLKDVNERFDEEGRSFAFYALSSQKDLKIPKDRLEVYDQNIKTYVGSINRYRENPISLKYFQYLALLFTDIYLEKYFVAPVALLNELNEFAAGIEDNDIYFSRDDLIKLAFWMATGSGKTLLTHINYLQFEHYNQGPNKIDFDNILLITPSEILSEQHLKELKKSNIPCELFVSNGGGLFAGALGEDRMLVLDIHKLTEEKKGQGVTIDIESFGSKNLVFVDEGHKGSGGEKWRKFRDFVAKEGFTFEYSATFGQAIASSGHESKALLHEYGKSIIFDYSYRYFYKDGYGKDYLILNLKDKAFSGETKDVLMLANLLSFFEQKLLFSEYQEEFAEYNIEEPLWVFVGSKVQGKQERSDILRIVQFLARVLKNENSWTVSTIERILEGESGLLDSQDRDVFSHTYPEKKLRYLRDRGLRPEEIYKAILQTVFHVENPASLHLVNVKNAGGEIALRAGNANYFGLINIGDDAEFLKMVKEKTDIPVENDELSSSLFEVINHRGSEINVLIGAKKFIEGWNCWRVSNMGLLNIGKSEGSQIIQLFGRGVRLHGKDWLLKRSRALEDNSPENLEILETLNIFGIEANYMDQFRQHLENEGIETDNYVPIQLPIEVNKDYLKRNLLVTKVEHQRFKQEQFLELEAVDSIKVHLNLMPRVEMVTSLEEAALHTPTRISSVKIEHNYLDLLDWGRIYFDLLEYRAEKRMFNFVFSKDVLKEVLEKHLYELYCPEDFVKPRRFEDIWRLEEIAVLILKKYLTAYYERSKNEWLQRNLELEQLTEGHGDLNFKPSIRVKESDIDLIDEIKAVIEDRKIYGDFESPFLTNVYFDRHIYQPLLTYSDKVDLVPKGLNPYEREFVEDLKQFCLTNPQLFQDTEMFVLRNLPKRGIGFFETRFFYPDFIIWINSDDRQHLLFVDPKGLAHAWEGLAEEKIQLHRRIKELEKRLSERCHGQSISLDSFIVSNTPYSEVRAIFRNKPQSELEKSHILFQVDDKDQYIEKIMSVALAIEPSKSYLELRLAPGTVEAERALEVLSREQVEPFEDALPLYSLKAAAGKFGEGQEVEEEGWVKVDIGRKLDKKMFVTKINGKSMEPHISDGSYCVFRSHPGGTRQGKIVLVQHQDIDDLETGGKYTVKVYESEKVSTEGEGWKHSVIRLKPLNPEYEPIELKELDEGSIQLIAEFIEVLPLQK